MNNMYDILAKINLLEGRGSKPDFLDLDKDGDRKESMKKAVNDKKKSVKEGEHGQGAMRLNPDFKKVGAKPGIADKLRAGAKKVADFVAPGDEDLLRDLERKTGGKRPVGEAAKPDFLDLDKDGDTKEPMKKAAADAKKKKPVNEGAGGIDQILARFPREVEQFKQGGELDLDLEEALWDYHYDRGTIRNYNADASEYIAQDLADHLGISESADESTLAEREFYSRDDFDDRAQPGDTIKTTRGVLIKTKSGVRHERSADDSDDADDRDDDKPRGRGRPKGSTRSLGAKGPTGRSKLMQKGAIKEDDLNEAVSEDDIEVLERLMDQAFAEGNNALGNALQDALEQIQGDQDESQYDDDQVNEKAVSKSQRAAAGIAHAAKKGDIPKSELRGASKEMAKMPSGELEKFAKTKEKGLPEKKKKEESVEETTTSGSVAPSEAAPKGKSNSIFGKGVYEAKLAESFNTKLSSILTESLDVSVTAKGDGTNSVTVTGNDVAPDVLMDLLKMAGMSGSSQEVYKPVGDMSGMMATQDGIGGQESFPEAAMCEMCGGHEGMHEAGCGGRTAVEEELANSADNTETMSTDYMVNKLAGGLNGPKLQVNPNNEGDNPLAMPALGKTAHSLNLGAMAEDVETQLENRLLNLYKRIK
jgi:hypothetical protein